MTETAKGDMTFLQELNINAANSGILSSLDGNIGFLSVPGSKEIGKMKVSSEVFEIVQTLLFCSNKNDNLVCFENSGKENCEIVFSRKVANEDLEALKNWL